MPNGLIQTGIAYPNSEHAKRSLACSIDYMNGTFVEFCGWEVTDFTCSDFELDKIKSNEKKHT